MPEFKLAAVRIVAVGPRRRAPRDQKRLAIIGNGMAAGRLLDELLRRGAAARFDIAVFGEEPHGCYNRILLGRVLGGGSADDITLKPTAWYAEQRHRRSTPASAVAGSTRRRDGSTTADGKEHPFDVAVFATGSAAVVPPIDGLRRPRRVAEGRRVRVPHGRRLRADPRRAPGRRARPWCSAAACSGSKRRRGCCDLGPARHRRPPRRHADEPPGGPHRRQFLRAGRRAGSASFVRTGAEPTARPRQRPRRGRRARRRARCCPPTCSCSPAASGPRIDAAEASDVPVERGHPRERPHGNGRARRVRRRRVCRARRQGVRHRAADLGAVRRPRRRPDRGEPAGPLPRVEGVHAAEGRRRRGRQHGR